MTGNPPIEVHVLGPLLVSQGGVSITPTAPKPRVVLAMLALHPDEVVPTAALVEELWGDCAPRSARSTIQSYVAHLRRLVAAARPTHGADQGRPVKEIVVTAPGGYRLDTGGGDVDVARFEELAKAGHRARQDGDYAGATRNFAAALDTWRGPALVDVQQGPHLQVDATRLAESRLNVVDCRIEADLRLGRHHELLGELSALVAQYRTHEGLSAHLMLALYRSGRRCEALAVYRNLHDSLAEEQGLEPMPPLRRLHQSMLVSDGGPVQPAETQYPATPGWDRRPTTGRPRGISAELAAIPWDAPDGTSGSGGHPTGYRPSVPACSGTGPAA